MRINDQNWNFFAVVRAFFPLTLVIAHLKHNFLSVISWLLLFMILSGKMGHAFGIPLLFVSPEYLGEVSVVSFMLIGFAMGGFVMGFNTYSYFKVGALYPFLTTIARPFYKFCLNNSLIPILFFSYYLYKVFNFQMEEEYASFWTCVTYGLGFLGGFSFFIIFSIFYFFPLNRKFKGHETQSTEPIHSVIHREVRWYDIFRKGKDRPYIYLGKGLRFMISRSSRHFDKELVEKVYAKNRINASLYELLTIISFFFFGFFKDNIYFEVPAAMSIVLLLTIILMLFSALQSWLRGWLYPLIIVVLIGMDYLSVRTDMFKYTSFAYGLNYDKHNKYTIDRIKEITFNDSIYQKSLESELAALEKWKKSTGEDKPKMVMVCTSGGGSRSTMWTMLILQKANRELGNKFITNTRLMTGASGGMIGAAFYRELFLRMQSGKINDANNPKFCDQIANDMLNSLAFTASTNDIFIRYQQYHVGEQSYTIDRGYAFEKQLNRNTGDMMNHKLTYYKQYEENGIIPKMIFSPTIINDGRRLFISPTSTSFLTHQFEENEIKAVENIDFHDLLSRQNTNDIKFTSVLRASATFPFVMPMMTIPTKPEIQLMDAGIRDNYGLKTALLYITTMKKWIEENTSGVILVEIRDTKKIMDDESYSKISFLGKITMPFGNMYKNFPKVQDYNQDELLNATKINLPFAVDVISFNLMENKTDRISLSWHLTSQEKKKIKAASNSETNKNSLEQLKNLLK